MEFILFGLFTMLCISLFLTIVKKNKFKGLFFLFRVFSVGIGIIFFTYWFFQKSIEQFLTDSTTVQVINELPQSIDFYIIKENQKDSKKKYWIEHLGKIRQEHYRLNYIKFKNNEDYWVCGFLGKNLTYFSKHTITNHNIDQIISIKNFTIDNDSHLDHIAFHIKNYKSQYISLATWVSIVLLILFLNIASFIKI